MQFPGTRRAVTAETADGREVVVERRTGETLQEYEARRTAAREPVVDPLQVEQRGYAEGRRDQKLEDRANARARRRRGGLGLVSVIVVLVAALGVLWLALAAREGSFAAGGAVVDQKVAEVTSPARVAANQAADRTGAAVENAGEAIASQGERIRETAQ